MKYQIRVAGVLSEGRQEILKQISREKPLKYVLIPEPDNPFDKNAIAVYSEDRSIKVGYIPKNSLITEKVKSGIDFDVNGLIIGGTDGKNYGLLLMCNSLNDNEKIEITNL